MKPSLQGRLRLGLILSLVVLFILQWWVVTHTVQSLTDDYVESRLVHDAETLLGAINIDSEGISLLPNRVDNIYHQPFSGHYFLVTVGDFQLRSRSLWDTDFPEHDRFSQLSYVEGPLDQWLLLKVNHYHKQGHTVNIAIAEDISLTEESLARFQILYAGVSLVVLVFLIFLQTFLVKRSFATLENVREELVRLGKGEIDRVNEDVPGEIYPLVKEFNGLLVIVDQRLQRSRNALGNLAHALKTPLTILMRLSERQDIQHLSDVKEQLKLHTGTIQRLMDRELRYARLAGSASPGVQFDCRTELPKLVETLSHLYHERGLHIDVNLERAPLYAGDRVDMIELFGNLLDNACKWAKSRVYLTVTGEKNLCFSVEDDGPGCADEQLTRLLERGVRLDESVAGHGLGLSIVQEIVQQYSGNISFSRSESLGGFKVSVELPSR